MSQYRLHIDVPLPHTQEDALAISSKIVEFFKKEVNNMDGIDSFNYRLGHDEDRQNRNYFVIDDAGHASTKKLKVALDKEDADAII